MADVAGTRQAARRGEPPGANCQVDPPRLVSTGNGRATASAWAAAIVDEPRAVFLDTETTGLGGDAEVIEIAVVARDGSLLLDTLVRPERPIPRDAFAIHGISDDTVANAPTWCEIYASLCTILDGGTAVVYNASFDRRIITQCCRHHTLRAPEPTWECAMRSYATFRGERDNRGRIRMHKLASAAMTFGASPGGHRAAADAFACRAVVLGMAGEHCRYASSDTY